MNEIFWWLSDRMSTTAGRGLLVRVERDMNIDTCIYKYSPQMQSSESGQCDWKFSYVPKRFAGEVSVEWNSGHSSRVQHHKLMTCKTFWEDITTGDHAPKFKWRKLAYRMKSFVLFSILTAWVNRLHDNIYGVARWHFLLINHSRAISANISVGSPIHWIPDTCQQQIRADL